MRIAIAFDCLYPYTTGGGEKMYLQYAQEFVKAGHQVDYLTREQWEGDGPALDEITVVPISGPLRLYDDEGVRLPATAAVFAAALGAHLARRRGRYDVLIVSATPVLNIFAARAALAGTRTRIIADWLEVWTPDQWLEYSGPAVGRIANALQWAAVRLSPLATGSSQHTEDGLMMNGLPARRFLRSPGLIAEVAEVTPRLDGVPGPVLFVGRHIQDKRVESIPAALAEARRSLPELRAVIGGRGPETEAVQAEVERCGVADAVDMPGFVDEGALDGLMQDALCLLNPSRREGYGLVVVEAAAHGTPSIVVDHPTNAATELVVDGVNGFVAASTSPQDLAAAILAVSEGGEQLRRSTREWYEDAIRTRTIAATVKGILAGLGEGTR